MRIFIIKYYFNKRQASTLLLIILLFIAFQTTIAQEPPPRPIEITVTQNIGFGAFTYGIAGGTVTVNSGGLRSSTGDIILLNLAIPFNPASYNMVANSGTLISILSDPSGYTLNGSSGGTMTLHITDSNPASPFVITTDPPASTSLNVGGTLTVGNSAANPAGSYSGTFDITFIQE